MLNNSGGIPLMYVVDVDAVNELIENKASVEHQHNISDVDGLQDALDTKVTANHNHAVNSIIGLQDALGSKASNEHQHSISDIDNLEAVLQQKVEIGDLTASEQLLIAQIAQKAPSLHSHNLGDVEGLTDAINELALSLENKASIFHYHDASEVANLEAFVQSKIPRSVSARSDSPPLNPFEGLIWTEVTSNINGDLTETWIYQKGRWVSLTKYSFDYWGPTSNISGNVSYNLPFDTRYDYLFKEFLVSCMYGTGTVDATTNYWRAIVTTQPTGNTFANSGALPNDGLSKLFSINQIFVPAAGERALLMFQKYGNAPGARLGISLRYHLVRK